MNDQQKKAAEDLASAVVNATEAGPKKVARIVAMRIQTADGPTEVSCIVFAETQEIAEKMEIRLSTPTQEELFGVAEQTDSRRWVPTLPQV